jgi:hypothetical protein
VVDLALGANGAVIGAGDDGNGRAFVVGCSVTGAAEHRVVGFARTDLNPSEADGESVVRVRRSGGKDGAISVNYRTVGNGTATPAEDFTESHGTLYWADGDRSDREIAIGIARDESPPEAQEAFHLSLDNVRGSAGYGSRLARVRIQPDGSREGRFRSTTSMARVRCPE